jgi:hypothetical protein
MEVGMNGSAKEGRCACTAEPFVGGETAIADATVAGSELYELIRGTLITIQNASGSCFGGNMRKRGVGMQWGMETDS